MADYKSCAWYQNGTCIRYDKSGAPISCADCEDYERRVVFKIEDLQERNGEMSVRKSCANCKHNKMGICHFGNVVGGRVCKTRKMKYWELADDAKADVLHDAETEHDIPKYKSCKLYINGSCDNAKIFADKPGVKLDCSKCKSYISDLSDYFTQYVPGRQDPGGDAQFTLNHSEAAIDAWETMVAAANAGLKDGCRLWFEYKRGYYKLPTNTPTNTPTEPEHDAVNHPNHYCKGGVECLDAIKAAIGDKYEGFLAGNVLKYVYRYPDKNGVEDCKKARYYLDKLIEVLSN